MRIYDITLPLAPDMPTWPGDPPIEVRQLQSIGEEADNNVSYIGMCVHAGTHVDALYHFMGGDTLTVDKLSLKTLTGRSWHRRPRDSRWFRRISRSTDS